MDTGRIVYDVIGYPPVDDGLFHDTVTLPRASAVARTLSGAEGTPFGITAADMALGLAPK